MTTYFNETPYTVVLKTVNGCTRIIEKGQIARTVKENPFTKIKYLGIDKNFKNI